MKFLIIHGSYGSSKSNWFPWLKNCLEKIDQQVISPDFPVDDWKDVTDKGVSVPTKKQNLTNWLNEFEKFLPEFSNEHFCAIGHSLGSLFILHLIEKYNIKLDCGIFVSPFLTKLKTDFWQINLANETFYKNDFDFSKIKKNIKKSYSVFSDNDQYVDQQYFQEFNANLDCQEIQIVNGFHLNSENNFTQIPIVYELCKSRVNYEKYLLE